MHASQYPCNKVARRREAKMGADVTGASEPVRPINRRPKGERRDRADARDAHQSSACFLSTDDIKDLLD
jgi:hypothetical protein